MSVFKRWNGTQWETIGPGVTSARFNNINNMIAPEFDPKNTYDVGDYVVQSDKLYRCINRIGTPQAWTNRNWREVKLGQDVTELRNDVVAVSDTQPTSENNRIWVKPNNESMAIPLVEDTMMLPSANNYGQKNQIPRSTGSSIEWVDFGLPSDEQTNNAITAWLNAHPEATTTVQDNSLNTNKYIDSSITTPKIADKNITENKLSDDLKLQVKNNYITPQMFGAVGDGETDDTAAFKALEALDADGLNIYIPTGHYIIKDHLTFTYNVNIWGDGETSFLDFTGYLDNFPCILVTGSYEEIGQLPSTLNINDQEITVPDISIYNIGDIISINDPTDYSWDDTRAYYRKGEYFKIIDIQSNKIILSNKSFDTYNNNCTISLLHPIVSKVSKLKIKILDRGTEISAIGLSLDYCMNSIISDVSAFGSNLAHIAVNHGYDTIIQNCKINYISNNFIGLNYAIGIGNSQFINVNNCFCTATRHGITVGGGDTLPTVNRFINISNCTCRSTEQYSADFHNNVQFCKYSNCNLLNGICIGGKDLTIENCTIHQFSGDNISIYVTNCNGSNLNIINNIIYNNTNIKNHRGAIYIVPHANLNQLNILNNRITGIDLDATAISVEIFQANSIKVFIKNNTIKYINEIISAMQSIIIRNCKNVIIDSNNIDGTIDVRLDQNVVNIGATLEYLLINNNIINKGGIANINLSLIQTPIDIMITNNIIKESIYSGITTGANNESNIHVLNNILIDCGAENGSSDRQSAIYLATFKQIIIKDNIIKAINKNLPISINSANTKSIINNNNQIIGYPTSSLRMQSYDEIVNQSSNKLSDLNVTIQFGSTAPASTAKTYSKGSIMLNSNPSSGSPIGWVCTTTGAPGDWRPLPNII